MIRQIAKAVPMTGHCYTLTESHGKNHYHHSIKPPTHGGLSALQVATFFASNKDTWEDQSAYVDCCDSPGSRDGPVFSLRATTSASPTLRCTGNVFAGSIFAAAAVPAKQEYSIQIPVYVSLDTVPLTQILKCTQISCFTSPQHKGIEQLNMPLANTRELIQLPESMAS